MQLHHKLANLLGYDLIRKEKSDLSLENHLSRILKKYPPSLVIDVGANKGQFGKKLRKFGYQGKIISFEPATMVFEELQKNISGDALWESHCFALGEKEEESKITIPLKGTDFSSLLKHNSYSEKRFEGKFEEVREETIKVKVLDEVIPVAQVNGGIFLKSDTQGYDLKVLKGADETLKKVQVLLVELSFIPIYEGMPTFQETCDFLKSKGFTPSGFFPVTKDKKTMAVIEMDGVFVRK